MSATELLITEFIQQFPLVKYPRGKVIFRDQKAADFFLFLKTGSVKMSQTTVAGNVVTLNVFFPESCISMLSLIKSPNTYEFETLTEVEAYQLPREKFIAFLRQQPDAAFVFLQRALKGLDTLMYRISQSSSSPAYQRVADLLLYFIQHAESKSQLKVTHQEIAEWLGLTRENVSIQMKKLERAGFIARNKRIIEVIDLKGLAKISKSLDAHSGS